MSEENVEILRRAYESWERGDVEAVVSLLDPAVYWRGVERGHLWWRRAPS